MAFLDSVLDSILPYSYRPFKMSPCSEVFDSFPLLFYVNYCIMKNLYPAHKSTSFFCILVFESHPIMLKPYSWLWAQRSLPACSGDYMECKSVSTVCKASTLPVILSLQPTQTNFLLCIFPVYNHTSLFIIHNHTSYIKHPITFYMSLRIHSENWNHTMISFPFIFLGSTYPVVCGSYFVHSV